eukprot:2148051-Alexandrium_andersonii.AAC.1
MCKVSKSASPALRHDDTWVVDATSKANVFAACFRRKWTLSDAAVNEFSAILGPLDDDSDRDFL